MAEMAHQRHELLGPMAPQLEQLLSMPGVKAITARDLGAAMGLDMTRFGSAARLSAWAGGAPGNQDRAGKRRRGRARKGNRSLRRVVGPWAWAPRETSTFVGRTFRRLEARVGGKKAAMVVAQKIVVIISQLLLEGTLYEEERYDRLGPRQEERERKRALKALERLGYAGTLDKVASATDHEHLMTPVVVPRQLVGPRESARRGGVCLDRDGDFVG
jgi:transposase